MTTQDAQDQVLDRLAQSGASEETVKEVASLFYEKPVDLSDETIAEVREIFASPSS